MDIKEIEQYSRQYLSSFDGDDMSSFQGDNLSFQGDNLSSYDGGSSTFERVPENFFVGRRTWVLTITNTATVQLGCYVLPGMPWAPGYEANGIVKTGAFAAINGASGLSASALPGSVELFYDFIKTNPTELVGLKVSSSLSTAQLEGVMIWEPVSPFAGLGNTPLMLGTSQTDMTYRDKIAGPFKMPADLAAAGPMRVTFPIEPASGSTPNIVTITFYGGLINSQDAKLVNASRAKLSR